MKPATRLILFLAMVLTGCATAIKPYAKFGLPKGTVVFTFDDGPNERSDTTARILDILERHGIKAYFCVIGKQVEKNPELARRMRDGGHVIVNHSYSHPNPLPLGKAETLKEIEMADRAIGTALGIRNYKSEYFRPPYALVTKAMRDIATGYPLRIAGLSVFDFFTVDSEYGPGNYRKVVDFYKQAIRKSEGGVIVLHDGCFRPAPTPEEDYGKPGKPVNRSWVPEALEELILCFQRENYSFAFERI
jgi:peptidoglycan/xylan/chitin deacetylase (PgdA/CDA1 family)